MPKTDLTIDGDVAVVTAAGSGIGRQIAQTLLKSGVNVTINDIDKDAVDDTVSAFESLAGNVIGVQGDASNPKDMGRVVETTVDEFGGLDIVVNNVGIAGPTKPCEDLTHDEFMGTLEVNLGGLFNTTTAAIPYLKDDGGRIVNISSMSGKRPLKNRTPYTTSKMGVIGFTRTLAVELADHNINVNAVCPGSVRGPRLDAVIEGQAESRNVPVEKVRKEFQDVAPMKEFVDAEDVADAVLLLCSDRTQKMTGQDVNVTAGIVMY